MRRRAIERSQQYDRVDQPGAADSIVQSIAREYEQSSVDAEAARATRDHPDDLDKRDLMIAASATPLQQITRQNYAARLALILRALVLDPSYAWALQADGRVRADRVFYGFSPDATADLAQALRSVDQALVLAPNDYAALREKSRVLRAQGDLDAAAAVIRRLIELRPSVSYRYNDLGWILMVQGHPKEALDNFMTASAWPSTPSPFNNRWAPTWRPHWWRMTALPRRSRKRAWP
jgi:tetratricopeptide (TPR) repeat protein